ncbi:MAG: TolC family protein, partial [Crocinitomicaceae bacterium]
MKYNIIIFYFLLTISVNVNAQLLSLDSILTIIEQNNPELKMFNAQISAMDAYAQGAKSWDAPQVGTGFFMTPYNPMMWKADKANYNNGMGSYMLSVQQMIPNQTKLKANETYMKSMSGVEKENKNFIRNQLLSDAKM